MAPPASEQSTIKVVQQADAEVQARVSDQLRQAGERAFDIALGAVGLLAMLPLMVIIALAIKLDSRGPVFFRVRRVGYRGEPLLMLKFRKMHDDAAGGPLTISGDPRLTRVGTVLTRTRLDELPQLWDVLRGRMSVVGPRPEDPRFVAMHRSAYARILSVRPGMTGISQLAFAEESQIIGEHDPVGDYVTRILPAKIRLDTLYASRHGIGLDLSILRWTVIALLLGRPIAVHRATCRMSVRKRPVSAEITPLTEPASTEPVAVAEAV